MSASIRALHLCAGNLFGGIEAMLVTIARSQKEFLDLESIFALSFEGRLASELRAAGAKVEVLGKARALFPWTVSSVRRRLRKFIEANSFEVAICHAFWPFAIFAPAVRESRLPLVFWCHSPPSGNHWIERWAHRIIPDLVISNSDYTNAGIRNFYPKVPAFVVNCPVAPPVKISSAVRAQVRASLGALPQDVVILIASRMEASKGHENLLEALKEIKTKNTWQVWVAGGAQNNKGRLLLESLKKRAISNNLQKRVHFLGERSDVSILMASADLYCQPNTTPESFGISLVEAQFAGLPVITSAIGGALEIVTTESGYLLSPNDVMGLSNAVAALIESKDAREKLGITGKKRVSEICNPTNSLQRLNMHLVELIAKNPS